MVDGAGYAGTPGTIPNPGITSGAASSGSELLSAGDLEKSGP